MEEHVRRILEHYRSRISTQLTRPRYKLKMTAEDAMAFLEPTYQMYVEHRGCRYKGITEQMREACRWLVAGKDSLILNGNVGSGKTTLARAICHVLVSLGTCKGCRIVSAQDLLRMDDNQRFEDVSNAPALVMDDLGTESLTSKVYGTTFTPAIEMIYKRYDRQLPTIITSNLSMETLCRTYGERVSDRFHEAYDTITFDNKSFRRM